MRIGRQAIAAVAVVALIVGLAGVSYASVSTDQADYSPGSSVTIKGDNSNGAGYLTGETVQVQVSGPNGYASSCTGTVADDGTWSCQVTLNSDDSAVGSYTYTTTGSQSGQLASEQGSFSDSKPDVTPEVVTPLDLNIPLNNDTALVGTGTNCPPASGTAYWHFVISPNNGNSAFVEFHLNLGDALTYNTTTWLPNAGQNDNVFVAVPTGKTLTSLNKTSSTADIHWNGNGTQPDKFQLSHTCPATAQPTSSLRTEVHGPNVAETVVPPATVSLGDTVHDAAFVTYANGSLGSNATVTFVLLTGSTDCTTGTAGTPQTVPISGASEAKAESAETAPLAPGNYAYQVTFDSGTSSLPDAGPECEPFTVTKANTTTATQVHDKDHNDITGQQVGLGSVVHDTATVGPQVGTFVISGTVTYSFFTNGTCDGAATSTQTVTIAANGTVPDSSDTLPLTPGHYGYQATYNDDSNYNGSTGVCEPFEVTKADTTTATQVHDATHKDITNGGVQMGSYVHDKATVGPQVGTFVISGTVTYSFFTNGTCYGAATSTQTVTIAANGTVPESTPQQINSPGSYAYQATYNDDSNYNGSTGVCEPFSVFQPGKTMGYWGNNNGQARILANGGYAANAVNIGRGANIDTQPESLKVLPNTLNACGKGSVTIFTGQNGSTDCSLATGINKASLNTLASQTLALGYNLKPALRPGFAGQTIGQLQCQAYITPALAPTALTAGSSVQQAFDAAVTLINGSASGGTTTQAQVGAMNSLLGCLNREA